jgi:hypothetical protein
MDGMNHLATIEKLDEALEVKANQLLKKNSGKYIINTLIQWR